MTLSEILSKTYRVSADYYKIHRTTIIVATPGMPAQDEIVTDSGDTGRYIPVKIPVISTTARHIIPQSIVRKALFRGFFFLVNLYINVYIKRKNKLITAYKITSIHSE